MFIVGLTGGIGTGKSTASRFFLELGIPVIDADFMARKVVEPGRKAWFAIKKEFGDGVFDDNCLLDRQALGDIIFDSVDKRRKLNEITHPEIYKEMTWAAFKYFTEGHQFIVMDLPLLYESGSMLKMLNKVIVVVCEEEEQIKRIVGRGILNEDRARLRVAAQMPLDEKCSKAHFVIDNNGSIAQLKEQVVAITKVLKASNAHWKIRAMFTSILVLFLYIFYSIFIYMFST